MGGLDSARQEIMSLRHELEERDEILRMVQAENELAVDEQKKRNSEIL